MSSPKITAVIPSVNRDELGRAIESVNQQTLRAETELVVVFDLPKASVPEPAGLQPGDQVLWTGGGRRGSAARNIGAAAGRAPWVAFLDDDDEWLPQKLERQLAAAESVEPARAVVSTQHRQFESSSDVMSAPVPKTVYQSPEKVSEYLFRRRRPGGGRASMYTSTLFTARQLALEAPWDETLSRHQDWDWLVTLDNQPQVQFVQLEEPLVTIHSGSAGSISASPDWESSLGWATSRLSSEPKGVLQDFLAAQTLRYAISARSGRGARAVVRAIASSKRLPSLGPILIAFAGLLPRRTLERLMARIR